MKCDVCGEERNNGNTYEFFSGFVGETEVDRSDIQVHIHKTPHYLHNRIKGWVCRGCYLKNLLFSEKTIVIVGITAIISSFGGKFINNFLAGLFFAGLALGLLWITNLPFFWTQHGDRALIRHHPLRKTLELELQEVVNAKSNYRAYKFYDRLAAYKLGWVKDNELKI
jgi:hypothetical protein